MPPAPALSPPRPRRPPSLSLAPSRARPHSSRGGRWRGRWAVRAPCMAMIRLLSLRLNLALMLSLFRLEHSVAVRILRFGCSGGAHCAALRLLGVLDRDFRDVLQQPRVRIIRRLHQPVGTELNIFSSGAHAPPCKRAGEPPPPCESWLTLCAGPPPLPPCSKPEADASTSRGCS